MTFERIEWIEFHDLAGEAEETDASRRVVSAQHCPKCGWLDTAMAVECFRCGFNFIVENRDLEFFKIHQIELPKTELYIDNSYQQLLDSRKPAPKLTAYQLRLRSEGMNLIQGFDKLISLDEVSIDRYEHQEKAVLTALNKMRGQVLLADEVGLGKTIQAGLILKELKLRGLIRRILILTPATVLKQWQEEMETKFHERFQIAEKVEDWRHPQVLASLSLAKMPHHATRILQREYDLLIIDEAHMLKRKSTQRFKFVNQIKKKYILLLTATPVHNTLTELYSLVTILKPGIFGTVRSFNKQFVDRDDPRRPKNPEHLKKILSQVMIRNRRSHVGIQLPPRRAGIFYIRLTQAERLLYDEVTAYIREEFKRETNHLFRLLSLTTLQRELCSSPHALRGTLEMMASRSEYPEATRKRLRHFLDLCAQIKIASKTQAVLKILKEYPGKFIIFTNFLATMQHLQEVLERRGVSTVVFHGNLNVQRRREVIQQFSRGKRILISTQAGGDGLNLQFCNQLINYDLPWNPMLVEQRIGRIHRLGQEKPVYVINLTLANTIESRIMHLLARKIQMFKLVIGELDLILGMLNRKESFEQTVSALWHKASDQREADRAFRAFGSELTKARKEYEKIRKTNEIFGDLVHLADFFDREEQSGKRSEGTQGRLSAPSSPKPQKRLVQGRSSGKGGRGNAEGEG